MHFISKIYAQCLPDDPVGCIVAPTNMPFDPANPLSGIIGLANSLLRLVFIVAGLWALVNFILAGFSFFTASGDPKKVTLAWEKIWMTVLGLVLIVSSFLLAAVVGILLFNDPFALINPKLTR
jgi:hypothetical protein